MAEKKWSRKFDCCIKCGKTDFKHVSKGICNSCYLKEYRENPENIDRVKEQKDKWYRKQEKGKAKQKREQDNFDGNREIALERDEYKCQWPNCGTKEKLTVHHIDGNGRGKKKEEKNNDLSNLITLCRKHHLETHREEINKNKVKKWCKYLNLDCCIECGKNNIKHIANGLCGNCYAKMKRKLNKAA